MGDGSLGRAAIWLVAQLDHITSLTSASEMPPARRTMASDQQQILLRRGHLQQAMRTTSTSLGRTQDRHRGILYRLSVVDHWPAKL